MACVHNIIILYFTVEFVDIGISVDPVKYKHAQNTSTTVVMVCVYIIINYYLFILISY